IQIRSNLTNVTIRNQTFAYIVQIQDKDGTIESLSWLSGMLLPSQTLSPSVSWTPSKAGNYTVQVFVWQSLNNPNSLSPPVFTDLTVWPSLSAYPGDTTGYLENRHCQSGYELVIKSGNGSPACVTPQTAQKLIERRWAKEITGSTTQQASIIQDMSTNVCGQFYTAPDNPPNLRETPALLMGLNSTACAKFTFT
ncbi:MAG: hypothetical protein KGI27_15520, partial [Thaumarchaeota archaeon]|nr:hypothetical protein [Nitrososphaerota archaeon]